MFLLLNPSEPCGFEQMVALRYGTVPIVCARGGFRDTVHEDAGALRNGFTFAAFEATAITAACLRAKSAYKDKAVWNEIVRNAMRCDNSWTTAATKYMDMYRQAAALWRRING
jgi:starch synthase